MSVVYLQFRLVSLVVSYQQALGCFEKVRCVLLHAGPSSDGQYLTSNQTIIMIHILLQDRRTSSYWIRFASTRALPIYSLSQILTDRRASFYRIRFASTSSAYVSRLPVDRDRVSRNTFWPLRSVVLRKGSPASSVPVQYRTTTRLFPRLQLFIHNLDCDNLLS
jgi:hypothetical protein